MNAAVLATRRAGDRAVLQFQEAAGVDHHGHDELTLPLREAEVCEARHPADTDAGGRDWDSRFEPPKSAERWNQPG